MTAAPNSGPEQRPRVAGLTREEAIPAFRQQVDRLVALGYPALAGLEQEEFLRLLEPLRPVAELHSGTGSPSRVPFVLVVAREVVAPESTVPLLRLDGGNRPGIVDRNHPDRGLSSYLPVGDCAPPAPAYLLLDVDRGEEFCGVPPEDAAAEVRRRGRTPLTIEEGIALVTQVPAMLEKNRCFSLAGSRRDDRRVPALWISERAPKLGWCWAGNPHGWLGLASTGGRVAG